jgi:hypothetical protein
VSEQALAQALPVVHLVLHPCLGVAPDKTADGAGDQAACRCRAATEAQLPRLQAIELADLVGQLLCAADQAPGVLQQYLALLGRCQVLATTVNQLAAGTVFQGLDAATERRLRQVHGQRRRDKTALFGKGNEVAKLAQIDMHFSHQKYPGNALAMH